MLQVIYHSMVRSRRCELEPLFHGSVRKWVWPDWGCDFSIAASWAIGPPGLDSGAQEFHFHPCDLNKPITASQLCTGAVGKPRAWGHSPQLSYHGTKPPSMTVCPYREGRGGTESLGLCTLSKPLQRGEWNRLFWALFILCSCSQSIKGSKEEMREVSQSSPTHHRLSRHVVQSDWQQTRGRQNSWAATSGDKLEQRGQP